MVGHLESEFWRHWAVGGERGDGGTARRTESLTFDHFLCPLPFPLWKPGVESVAVSAQELAMIVQVSTGMLAATECRGASEITDALERDCFIITEYKFL